MLAYNLVESYLTAYPYVCVKSVSCLSVFTFSYPVLYELHTIKFFLSVQVKTKAECQWKLSCADALCSNQHVLISLQRNQTAGTVEAGALMMRYLHVRR